MGETEVASTPVTAKKSKKEKKIAKTEEASSSTPVTAKKSKKEKKTRKPKATHPKVAEMVDAAMDDLHLEKGEASLHAIKTYIASNYKVNMDKQAIFIKRYLRSQVAAGSLIKTKGQGTQGSFKKANVEFANKKTARQKVIASKPASPEPRKASKALAKKPVVKKLETKTPVKKIKTTSASKAKSAAKKK